MKLTKTSTFNVFNIFLDLPLNCSCDGADPVTVSMIINRALSPTKYSIKFNSCFDRLNIWEFDERPFLKVCANTEELRDYLPDEVVGILEDLNKREFVR